MALKVKLKSLNKINSSWTGELEEGADEFSRIYYKRMKNWNVGKKSQETWKIHSELPVPSS